MRIQRGYKTELDLNDVQRTACAKAAGAARFTYNWGLAEKERAYQAGEKTPTAIDLHRRLNALKATEYPWMYEISKCAPQEALRCLDRAFDHFFRRCKLKAAGKWKGKCGFPRRKSRKKGLGNFRLTGVIHVEESAIQLPRLGRLRLKERGYLPTSGVKILSATVSEQAGHWFVSVQVQQDIPEPPVRDGGMVGVDLGVKTLATVSDGTTIENPRALGSNLKRLKRLQRRVSRKIKGSHNRRKAVRRLARQHARIANIRKDVLHKATTMLTKTKSALVLEDLNVAGMLKNHRLARAIADVGLGEFRRQATYKGAWYRCEIIEAERFFPSSKRHAVCGHINEGLTLSDRVWLCGGCGAFVDRDANAADNLEWYGRTVSSTVTWAQALNACGESGSGPSATSGETALAEAGTEHMEGRVS